MSGLEVIGGISAVITLLDASIKIYDSAQSDVKLSETFEVVRRRLPVILHILQRCKNVLEQGKDSMPSDVCEALEKILDACDENARKLKDIFEMVIPGERDTWEKRYAKVIRRLGKGSKVEQLMATLTQDVQLLVNNNAVDSATPEQNVDFSFRGPAGIQLGQAPYIASELFVGRSYELDEIAKALHHGHKAQKQGRLVLGGMGGIGKTQLAIAYAHSSRGSYSSVFWLNAVSEATLKDGFRSIASHIFDVQEPGVLEAKEIVRRVHQWLSTSKNTGWLLIFDNYDDPDQFRIDDYYPPASHGAIVVTTRRPDLVAGSTLDIKPLQNIEDSLAILQTRSERENVQSDPYAKRLAKRLAGLPLALATAGTYLRRRKGFTFERYLQEYEKRWNIDPRWRAELNEYEERTLYTTWDISYSRLEKEDPDAAKMLKLLAYFDNQSLWYGLFHAGLTDSSPEWLREVITDDVNFNGVMGVLAEYYFLDTHQTSESWSIHNCVHDWTLAAINKDIDAKNYWYAFDCVSASINDAHTDDFATLSYSPLAAHATRLVQRRFCQNDVVYNIAPHRLDQASRIADLLRDQVHLLAAEQMYQWALSEKENALKPDHTSTLDTVYSLGILYCHQGNLAQAEQMYQRALAGYENALGPDHTSTLDTIRNLGVLYRNQGKLHEAEQMYQRALAGFLKTLGPDHTSTLNTVCGLGVLYWKQGKLHQAEQMYQRALAGYEKALGPDHTSALDTVYGLGILYWHQGSLDQAGQMYQRALAGYEKALGPDHTSTLNAICGLGFLYRDQSKLHLAEQMYQRALAGYEEALGPDHTSALDTVCGLGSLYQAQGKLDQAEQMYRRALAGLEKALGPDHTSTLDTVYGLGILYRDQGKLDQAEQMYCRALTGFEKALGPDHTSTLDTVNGLGILYWDRGNLGQAEQMYCRALTGFEKALGPDHTSTLNTVHNLGILYQDQGNLDQAEQMYQRALAGREKALGPDHTSTLDTVNNLGVLYRDQGKLDQALAGYEKALGPDHTSTLNTVHSLGILYRDQGNLDQAEQMYQRALAGYEKALGAEHMSTLDTVNGLGIIYWKQGKLHQAEQMYQRALAGYEKVLGPDHTSTLDTVDNLGVLYRGQGKLVQAEQISRRALAGKEKRNSTTCFFER